MNLPETYDAPWPEDLAEAKLMRTAGSRTLRGLKKRGLAVDRVVKATSRVVNAIIGEWCSAYAVVAREDTALPSDSECELICNLVGGRHKYMRLDGGAVQMVVELMFGDQIRELNTREFAVRELERIHALSMVGHTDIGNWATAMFQLGDHRAALRAAAYLQENGDDKDLARAHQVRACVFSEREQVGKATAELRRSLAVIRRGRGGSDPCDHTWLARLYVADAEPEKAAQSLLDALRRIRQATSRLPEHTPMGICYRLAEDTYVECSFMRNALRESIVLVTVLEERFPFEPASLVEARKRILEARVTLEEHREHMQHAENHGTGGTT